MKIFTPETAVECANYAYDKLAEQHPALPTVSELTPRRRSWFLVTALGVGELVTQPNGPLGPDSINEELVKRGLDEVDPDITLSMTAFYIDGDYVDLPVTSVGNAIHQTACFCDRHDELRPASETFKLWLAHWKAGRDIPLTGPEFEAGLHAAVRLNLGLFPELKDETIIIPPGNPMTIPVPHVEPIGLFMREVAREEYEAAMKRNGAAAEPLVKTAQYRRGPPVAWPWDGPPVEECDDPQQELILRAAKRLRNVLEPHTAYQRETEVKSWRGNGLIVTTSYTVGGTLVVEVKSDREEKDDGEEP